MGFTVKNDVSPMLEAAMVQLSPSRIGKRVGVDCRELVKAHFFKLNQARHKAATTTGFYAEAAKNTQMTADGGNATITVNKIGVRQRLFGGPIVAGAGGTGKKYLTIPAQDAALGKTAREFDNLAVVYRRIGGQVTAIGLAEAVGETKTGHLKPGESVMFWLRQSVLQQPDSSVLPSDDEFKKTINNSIQKLITAAKKKEHGEQ